MRNRILLNEDLYIYVDDTTGKSYIFDGEKLVDYNQPSSNQNGSSNSNDSNSTDSSDSSQSGNSKNNDSSSKQQKSSQSPRIGDKGNKDELADEDARREQQAAAERREDNDEEESEEDKAKRIKNIENALKNAETSQKIKDDSARQIDLDKSRKKAAEKRYLEKNLKGATKNLKVMSELNKDLGSFLSKEIGASERNPTWRKYNANYGERGLLRPGHAYEPIHRIPTIQMYIDQSGSWGEEDIKIGKDILNSIIQFEHKKQIKTEIYYFANDVHPDAESARAEGGTGAFTEIMKQLNSTKPDNVIVMTDDDFDGPHWAGEGTYTAPGRVWLIFRDGRSKRLIDSLHGKKGTKIYDIDRT